MVDNIDCITPNPTMVDIDFITPNPTMVDSGEELTHIFFSNTEKAQPNLPIPV